MTKVDVSKECSVHDRCEDTWWVLFIHSNIKIIMIGTCLYGYSMNPLLFIAS